MPVLKTFLFATAVEHMYKISISDVFGRPETGINDLRGNSRRLNCGCQHAQIIKIVNFFRDGLLKLISSRDLSQDLSKSQELFGDLLLKWRPFFLSPPSPFIGIDIFAIDIHYNPRMRSRAGLCKPSERVIELNPHLLKDEKTLEEVFIHEICHMAISYRWPYADAHGPKWKKLMTLCGFKPLRCHNLVPVKRHLQQRWDHTCECQIHKVTTLISNRISKGQNYKCKRCGAMLEPSQ
jgi:predicted SprT family Zn-dependent metalloprotease